MAATLILITPRPFWVLVAGLEPGLAAASLARRERLLEIQQFLAEMGAMVLYLPAETAETEGTEGTEGTAVLLVMLEIQELHREVVVAAVVLLMVAVPAQPGR